MRRPVLITLLFAALFTGKVNAQEKVTERQITLSIDNGTLKSLLVAINAETGIEFSYSSHKINIHQKINVHAEDEPISAVMDRLFSQLLISYEEVGGKIVLKPTQFDENQKTTLSGFVKDSQSGETLIGATVYIPALQSGAITNAFGYFSLSVPPNQYDVIVSYVGYQNQVKSLNLTDKIEFDFSLEADQNVLETVEVTPDEDQLILENVKSGVIAIDNAQLTQKAFALGQPDLIKSLDVIPGVQLFKDGSSFFNVRGGARDQNQILLDDAPIYNPSHLLGLLSSLSPEAVKAAKLYKGDLPANFGGKIASVLDLRARDGDMKQWGVEGSLGMVAGRLAVEGPIKKDKSSVYISGRKSHINGVLQAIQPDVRKIHFSDFHAKTNLSINRDNRVYLSGYQGVDEFSFNKGGIGWSNRSGTLRWNHIFSPKWFANATFYASKYQYQLSGDNNLTWKSHIANASLKLDLTRYKNDRNTAQMGFKFSGHNFNPGNVEDSLGQIPYGLSFVPKRNASETSFYWSQELRAGKKWWITYGFRLSNWANFGRTIEYEFDSAYNFVDSTHYNDRSKYHEIGNLEPRLNLTFQATDHHYFKLNYTNTVQYFTLISNSISPFNNLEVWLPASINIKPQRANQLTLGWLLNYEKWSFSMDAYAKVMENQIDYPDQPKLLLNPLIEGELRTGLGEASGIELTLSKKSGRFTGWVAYAYARSFVQIDEINLGNKYPTNWDRPHQFVLFGNLSMGRKSNLSGTFYWSSGAPITTPTSFYQFQDRVVPYYSEKNNDRLPNYHRFDLSYRVQLNKPERDFKHALKFSLFNLYSQKNTIFQNFNKIQLEDGSYSVPGNVLGNDHLKSTHIFVYTVVPSISYEFKL